MVKNDTLKNGTSRIGLYGIAPPGLFNEFNISVKSSVRLHKVSKTLSKALSVQTKGRMMGDTINEYAGQIKTARTEGLLSRFIGKGHSWPNYSVISLWPWIADLV